MGFVASRMHPGVYWNEALEVGTVTHVDDLLCSGTEEILLSVKDLLTQKYEAKGRLMSEE